METLTTGPAPVTATTSEFTRWPSNLTFPGFLGNSEVAISEDGNVSGVPASIAFDDTDGFTTWVGQVKTVARIHQAICRLNPHQMAEAGLVPVPTQKVKDMFYSRAWTTRGFHSPPEGFSRDLFDHGLDLLMTGWVSPDAQLDDFGTPVIRPQSSAEDLDHTTAPKWVLNQVGVSEAISHENHARGSVPAYLYAEPESEQVAHLLAIVDAGGELLNTMRSLEGNPSWQLSWERTQKFSGLAAAQKAFAGKSIRPRLVSNIISRYGSWVRQEDLGTRHLSGTTTVYAAANVTVNPTHAASLESATKVARYAQMELNKRGLGQVILEQRKSSGYQSVNGMSYELWVTMDADLFLAHQEHFRSQRNPSVWTVIA